jgi:hypothetical protein
VRYALGAVSRAAQRFTGRKPVGDDRAGRGTKEVVAAAQIDPGGVLKSRQQAGHPSLAKDPATTEDEDIGASPHGAEGSDVRADGGASAVCDNIRT